MPVLRWSTTWSVAKLFGECTVSKYCEDWFRISQYSLTRHNYRCLWSEWKWTFVDVILGSNVHSRLMPGVLCCHWGLLRWNAITFTQKRSILIYFGIMFVSHMENIFRYIKTFKMIFVELISFQCVFGFCSYGRGRSRCRMQCDKEKDGTQIRL